ncbi:hypothetical protein BH24BAC1_BH24BAC1_38250 [soil metagenome]
MKKVVKYLVFAGLVFGLTVRGFSQSQGFKPQAHISIHGEKWYINCEPTRKGKKGRGYAVEGLLPNARMVQGIFDDLNPETKNLWKYPDTGKWDAARNTREFLAAMDAWAAHGLLAFTLNLQGGSPYGYSNDQPWLTSAIDEKGNLRPDFMNRLSLIIEKADRLGMVVMLGIFYFGQDERIKDEAAVKKSVDNTVKWVLDRGYRNVLIEVANESNNNKYDHEIIKQPRIHELIEQVKKQERNGYRLLVSTSFNGGSIPPDRVVAASDYILIHGNGVKEPAGLNNMANIIRNKVAYTPKPIVNNEDDHFDFDQPFNNFVASTSSYVSWGYFDYRKADEPFEEGYQTMPADWGINSARKKGFFNLVKEMTDAK